MIKKGVVHTLPRDLQEAITFFQATMVAWESITPLARNEWICWVTSAKKMETRSLRIERTCTELAKGKRRPCCWPGCPHR
ncbi:MAG: YdeI/OmpD-associated family protein [Patescibacteria group bacterium]|nr:YdeI/OmpD-associated family protein [Patescibacteria group bacterium]